MFEIELEILVYLRTYVLYTEVFNDINNQYSLERLFFNTCIKKKKKKRGSRN